MPKYKVYMARTTWLTVNVEADDEDDALERAYESAPPFSAQESGWGSLGKWTADAGQWMPVDEFLNVSGHQGPPVGPVVEPVTEEG